MNILYFIYGEILLSLAVFLALIFIPAPYGKFFSKKWGPSLNARIGWILMESPAVIIPIIYFILFEGYKNPVLIVFLGIWELHYLQRTVVYPILLSSHSRPMPCLIPLMAFSFNLLNGYVNGKGIYGVSDLSLDWLIDIRFIVGTGLFITGWLINIHSDRILRKLRNNNDQYVIPNEGLHRLVANPNYFGEILEWTGWAILTWNMAGVAFALFTFANLAPRARKNLLWYRENFDDYPDHRKAVIPFLF